MKPEKITFIRNEDDAMFNLFIKYYSLYKLNDGRIIAVNDKTKEYVNLRNKEHIQSILMRLYFLAEHKTVLKKKVNSAYEMIKSLSDVCSDYKEYVDTLYQRNGKIIYNVVGTDSYIQIDEDSVKKLKKSKSNMIFNTTSCRSVIPNIENDKCNNYLKYIKIMFNVEEEQQILFAVYIVTLFIMNINHPLLLISGDYGAAKTTTARKIIRILNPNNDLTQMSKKTDDVAVLLSNNYLIGFDNVSKEALTREMADLLCSAITGTNFQTRRLYTNNEICTLQIHSSIIINGLDLQFPYSDLMDRSIMINFKRIDAKNRLTEKQVWDEFYSILPELQGCIFHIICKSMKIYEHIVLDNLPRLADFAKWGYAISEAITSGLGETFLQQYFGNIRTSSMMAIENDCLLSTLQDLMSQYDCWEGSATDLLKVLKDIYFRKNNTKILPREFPLAANTLSRRLRGIDVEIKSMGLSVNIGKDTKRYISIKNEGAKTNDKRNN